MMRSFGWVGRASLAVFLVTTPTSWAAPPTDCETSGSVEACMGELLDAQGDLIDSAADMLSDAEAMSLFSFGRKRFGLVEAGTDLQSDLEARIESLRSEHGRASAVHRTVPDSDYDEMIAPGDNVKGKKCKFSDIIFFESLEGQPPPGLRPVTDQKFGDGKCNIFRAEDENGINVVVNERKENMCERVCEEKVVGGVNQKGKSKERLVGRLQDGISASVLATESISAQTVRMAELHFLLSSLPSSEDDFRLSIANGTGPCDSGFAVPGDLIAAEVINVIIVGLDVAIIAGNIITEILDTVKDVGEDACKQDVAGFNASSGCIPLTVAFHISKGITDLLGGIQSGLASTRDIILLAGEIARSFQTDTLQTCTKDIKTDTDILKGQITGLEAAAAETSVELAAIKEELALLMSLLETTRDLLLTPQGRRQGFQP